jgi:hypothetical protein
MKGYGLIPRKRNPAQKKILVLALVLITVLVIGYTVLVKDEYSIVAAENKVYALKKDGVSPNTTSNNSRPGNYEPILNEARLQLESVDNVDKLTVILPGKDNDNNNTKKYNYEWFVNNSVNTTSTNTIYGFKKGDKISVKITPSDGATLGQPKVLSIEIANVTPKVVENKKISFDGKLLSYQVKAVDPSGGPVTYALNDAPKGMTIDSQTGLINWQVRQEDYGQHNIKVKISNNGGAEVVYPLNLDIGKITD